MSYFIAHLNDGRTFTEKGLEQEKRSKGFKGSAWDYFREQGLIEEISSLELKLLSGSLINLPRRHDSWQYFQFKYAEAAPQLGKTTVLAQIIGVVVDDQGNSILAVYISNSPDILVTLDNIHDIRLFRIGHINFKLHNIKLPVPEFGCKYCR